MAAGSGSPFSLGGIKVVASPMVSRGVIAVHPEDAKRVAASSKSE